MNKSTWLQSTYRPVHRKHGVLRCVRVNLGLFLAHACHDDNILARMRESARARFHARYWVRMKPGVGDTCVRYSEYQINAGLAPSYTSIHIHEVLFSSCQREGHGRQASYCMALGLVHWLFAESDTSSN